MQPLPRLFLFTLLASVMLPTLVGCGASGALPPAAPFVAEFPTAPTGETEPPIPVPPPVPPQTPVFDADAYIHARHVPLGAFPSDVVHYAGTLFTTDGDQPDTHGAWVVPLELRAGGPIDSPRFAPTLIPTDQLRDSEGHAPTTARPIAFGPFLNDLEIVADELGFVLANAGGSDSAPTLANLVAFDPSTGRVLQVVDLAQLYAAPAPIQDSSGGAVPGSAFVQSGAEAMAWTPTGPGTGRLHVAMANLIIGAPSYGAVKYPATVQVFDVTVGSETPVRTTAPAAVLAPPGFNPVSLHAFESDGTTAFQREPRLLVTLGGTTGWDAQGRLVPTTDASVAAYASDTGQHLGTFLLGRAGLAATRPAIGRDAVGHRVGFFPSAVTGEVYLLRLDGLYSRTIDPTRLAVLRGPLNGIPIASDASGSPGGNVTGVGLAPDGLTLVVAGFGDLFALPVPQPGRIYLLGLPQDLVTGAGFGTSFIPGSTLHATVPGRALGALVLDPNPGDRPDVHVAVSSAIDTSTYLAEGNASLGTLQTFGLIHE